MLHRFRRTLQHTVGIVAGALVLPLVVSCTLPPLDRTPVSGGTASQRERVRDGLKEFEQSVGNDRVRLSEVRLEPSEWPGEYHVWGRRVTLADDLSDRSLEDVLRHELCHALDFQGDLARRPDPFLDAIAAELSAAQSVDSLGGTARRRRSEALAVYCSLGPVTAQLLATPCAGDDADGTAIAAWLLDEVWVGGLAPILPPEEDSSWIVGPVVDMRVDPTEREGVAEFEVWTGDIGVDGTAYLDLRAAEVLDLPSGALAPAFDLVAQPRSDLPPGTVGDAAELDDGTFAAIVSFWVGPLPAMVPRLVWSDGADWFLPAESCTRSGQVVFGTPGSLWTAWPEADRVGWRGVGP